MLSPTPRPPSSVRVTSLSAAVAPISKRRRSLSPSASPSPPRVSPTFVLLSSSELDESSPAARSIVLLSSSPPPWGSWGPANTSHTSTSSPHPDPLGPSRQPSPIHQDDFTASPVPVPAALSHAAVPSPPTLPRLWTLAEVVEHCTSWEEYVRCRPVGYRQLSSGWAVFDERIRKRRYKHPREAQSDVFAHVRSYTQQYLLYIFQP